MLYTKLKMKNKKLQRRLVISLYVLLNTVILSQSAISGQTSGKISSYFSAVLRNAINVVIPPKIQKEVKADNLVVKDNWGNSILEGENYQIPLAVTRRLIVDINPDNTTNKDLVFTSSDPSSLRVTSLGYLEARTLSSSIRVEITSAYENVSTHFYVNITNKEAPTDFRINDLDKDLYVGSSAKLSLSLLPGSIQERESDVNLVNYISSDESVISVSSFGIIKGLKNGKSTISGLDSNGNVIDSKEINVITAPYEIVKPTSLTLEGPTSGYIYTSLKLVPVFNNQDVTEKDLTFISSNPAVATVDDNGLVYGNKIEGKALITAFTNIDETIRSEIEVTFVELKPSKIESKLVSNEDLLRIDSNFSIDFILSHNLDNKNLPITNNDVDIVLSPVDAASVVSKSYSNGKTRIVFKGRKRTNLTITASSSADPNISTSLTIEIKNALVIPGGKLDEFNMYIRKSIGHFTLFLVTGFVGLYTFYLYLNKHKKAKLLITSITLGIGALIAAISEIIQYFVPQRKAAFSDVALDFVGYLLGFVIALIILYLYQRHKSKKLLNKKEDIN